MSTFDFDAARRERLAAYDPITFTLGGKSFKCKAAIPFESLILAMDLERELPRDALFRHTCGFVAECLADDANRKRWAGVLVNESEPVEPDDVYAVTRWLVGLYAARPTSPSPGSSRGRRRTGASSNGKGSATSRPKASPR